MKKLGYAFGALLLAGVAQPVGAQGQAPVVSYQVAFPNAVHHEAQIEATFRTGDRAPLRIEMARSSPGRYALHEFAKNVYSVSATDSRGRPLQIARSDPYGWTVHGHDGTVRFRYTLFADRGDGTYAQVDASHAHLNIPPVFAFSPSLDGPVAVSFALPDPSWRIATQLPQSGNVYTAPNRQYFMDSPIEIAPLRFREWPAGGRGDNRRVRIALHSPDVDADFDLFATMAERVYRQHVAVWGDVPRYDHGVYTFLADYVPQASGDGMEHRNSTYITGGQSLREDKFSQIETLSHEVFHSWNVERLRPRDLEPFDFRRANPSTMLWFAEGFTQYYGSLLVRRAGVRGTDNYLAMLGGGLGSVLAATGRRYAGPQEMSLRAPFVDAAASIDPTNPNIFISYYTYGSVLALALDLELRARGSSLDMVMRALWKSHGATERPFALDDFRAALRAVSGDAAWADRFVGTSIQGSALPDYATLFRPFGLTFRPRDSKRPWIGPAIRVKEGQLVVDGSPSPGSPLYVAGIDRGDTILTVDGKAVADDAQMGAALAALRPGEAVAIRYRQRGVEKSASIIPQVHPAMELVRNEAIGVAVTPEQKRLRDQWLGPEGEMLPS